MGSLRVALAGKGGAGKTTISATLARTFARQGREVTVIDGDSNPNVSIALGVDRVTAETLQPLPITLISRKLNGAALKEPVEEVMATHGIAAPDGVTVLMMGQPSHADEGCLCTSHAVVAGLLNDMASRVDNVTILDLEASPEHLSRGTTRSADALLLVVEPYYRSYETARRMSALAAELPINRVSVVANKLKTALDLQAIEEFCERYSLHLDGRIPWSDAVIEADKEGVPIIEYEPAGAVVAAIAELAETLLRTRIEAPVSN